VRLSPWSLVAGFLAPVILAFWLGALAGCAAIESPSPAALEGDVDLRAAWAGPVVPGPVAGEAWWLALGGEELDRLVREALEHNHDLAASAARLRTARSVVRNARAALGPSLDLSAGAQRQRLNFIGFPIPGAESDVLTTTTPSVDAGFTANWEVDLWNRLEKGQRAALADQEAAIADLAAARESIAAATVRAWLAAAEARRQVELTQLTLGAWRETEEVVRERYLSGLTGALELRLARSNSASAQAELATTRRLLGDARRGLELVLGRYPEGSLDSGAQLEAEPGPAPAGLPVELLGRRPDLLAARLRLESARQRAGAARADLWPRLTLTTDLGRSSVALADLLNGDFTVWGLGARLAAPIYDGGRRRAAIDGADAATEEAAARLAGAVLVACDEVERALVAEGLLRERARHLGRARDEAAQATTLAREQYRAGLIDVAGLLDTQRREFAAEAQRLRARRERLASRVDLHLALGGGFGEDS
jgi:outer membrane protein, multidrug efflux system